MLVPVIPAKAGIQSLNFLFKIVLATWIPAFAGMTNCLAGMTGGER